MGCNYLPLPLIPAFRTQGLNYVHILLAITLPQKGRSVHWHDTNTFISEPLPQTMIHHHLLGTREYNMIEFWIEILFLCGGTWFEWGPSLQSPWCWIAVASHECYDVKWTETRTFVNRLCQANNKENNKARYYQWTGNQLCGNCFHITASAIR